MKYRILLGILFSLALGCLPAAAQPDGTAKAVKIAEGGVINGKAVSLPKPAYPATAKAVSASGAVSVRVTIDEEGNVVSAEAVSGHPLLRAVAVDAAKRAKFKPTMLSGMAVKVSGIIIYNFLPRFSWRQIGYELSMAEQSDKLPRAFPINSIGAGIPGDWIGEQLQVTKLKLKQLAAGTEEEQKQAHLAGGGTVDIASIDHKEIIGSLRSSAETRLNSDPEMLWNFRLGLLLGKMSAQIDDDNALRANIGELLQLEADTPADFAKQLNSFSEFANKNEFSAEDKVQIQDLIIKLKAN
jgi:TonB family protein